MFYHLKEYKKKIYFRNRFFLIIRFSIIFVSVSFVIWIRVRVKNTFFPVKYDQIVDISGSLY